jgi:hypothetical protein
MKEETRNSVSSVTSIISSIVLIIIAILGYLVSSDVRTIQKESDQRARAKQVQEFWNDVYVVAQAGADKSAALGSAITKCMFTGGELLENYRRVYSSDTKDIVKNDPKYNASLTSFLGDYANFLSKIDSVAVEYDSLRLKYAALAQEYRLKAWGNFFNQSEQVHAWKEKVSRNTYTFYFTLLDGIKNHISPNELLSQIAPIVASIGSDITNLSVPYLKGLSEFSAANLENISKTVAK